MFFGITVGDDYINTIWWTKTELSGIDGIIKINQDDPYNGYDDIISTLQFDNYGRTVSQQGKYGNGESVGAGAYNEEKKEKGAGGLGGKISPSAVLVIQNGKTKLVNIKNQDTMTKILDLIPDVMDRFENRKEKKVTEEDINELLDDAQ